LTAKLIFSAGIALIFFADRTGLWLKEQKQFNPWIFGSLCFISLAIGLASVRQADKDLGFLNREQTDEWKGWMQGQSPSHPRPSSLSDSVTLCSRYLDIPLLWCIENIWYIQPNPRPCRVVPVYDWVWSYHVLYKEIRFRFSACCTSELYASVCPTKTHRVL
jgi:hypothetical protein